MVADGWDPRQYARFAAERRQPFVDLLGLVQPIAGGAAVDLGCGTGVLTVELHRTLGLRATVGVDSSSAMLREAPTEAGVAFEVGDIATYVAPAPLDLVFANAALQWVPDHETVIPRLAAQLAPRGQLAIQVPANFDHASHRVVQEVAAEMLDDVPPDPVATNVLLPERYAELLHECGFEAQHVRLQVYGHRLGTTADVVEWTKGTTLTRFRRLLDDDAYERFVDRYRTRLLAVLGERSPYFYAFKRILLWARSPA